TSACRDGSPVPGPAGQSLPRASACPDAAEAEGAPPGGDLLWSVGGGAVAQAVGVGAEERAALDDPPRDAELGLRGVEAAFLRRDRLRGGCAAAVRLGGVGRPTHGVPVAGPLPDVPRHVVQAVPV